MDSAGFRPSRCRMLYIVPALVASAVAGRAGAFESGEHQLLGDGATLTFSSGDVSAGTRPFILPNGLSVTYGQIVALAGDYYGVIDDAGNNPQPISDDPRPPTVFQMAFDRLARLPASVKEAQALVAVFADEIAAVNTKIAQHQQGSAAYQENADQWLAKYNVITRGGSDFSDMFPFGRMVQLAETSWDHFGSHAVTAYNIGHAAAINQAFIARVAPVGDRDDALAIAYAMNAFADHFLTDLFSAGHLRTPRKELYELARAGAWATGAFGSLCSRWCCQSNRNLSPIGGTSPKPKSRLSRDCPPLSKRG